MPVTTEMGWLIKGEGMEGEEGFSGANSTSNIRRNALKRVIFPGKYVPVPALWLDTTNGAANMPPIPVLNYCLRSNLTMTMAEFNFPDPLPTETNLLFYDARDFNPQI